MTLYKLCEWEENGYHDSYGKLCYFNTETNSLGVVEHWATAYPGGLDTSAYLIPCGLVLEQARRVLETNIFRRLVEAEKQLVFHPEDEQLKVGMRVRTSKAVRNKGRETSVCPKCNGSGHWANPRNPQDKRTCFKCRGTGQVQGKATGVSVKIPKDTAGEIVDTYKYNPRSAINFTIKADDGSLFRCGCKSLRLDREPVSEQVDRRAAFELSFLFGWKAAVSKFGGWLSTDWTAPVARETYTAVCPDCGGDGRLDDRGHLTCCGKCCIDIAGWYAYCVEQAECEAAQWDRGNYYTPKEAARDLAIALDDYKAAVNA